LIELRDENLKAVMTHQGTLDETMVTANYDANSLLQGELGLINEQLDKNKAGYRTDDIEQQGDIEDELLRQKGVIEEKLQGIVGSQALEQQGLKGELMLDVTALEGKYKTLMATKGAAATIFANASLVMSEILANPDISTIAKDALIKHQVTLLKSALNVVGAIGDIDLTDLLTFGDGDNIAFPGGPGGPWGPYGPGG